MKQGKQVLMQKRIARWAAFAVLGVLAACSYSGGIDQPFAQKVAWFSYLNGDDIRSACVPGAADQYRLVYNGEYDRQVRTYEILGAPPNVAGGASYLARVQRGGGIDLMNFSFSRPGGAGGWIKREAQLTPAQMAELERALEASGAFAPAPAGLELASEEYYWLFVGCREGVVHFNAWRYTGGDFAKLSFPSVLLKHDETGVKINPPREVGPVNRTQRTLREDATPRFDITIGENGLWGLGPRL